MKALIKFVLFSLLFWGCSDKVAKPAGSETVNTYTILVTDSAGQGVASSEVRVIKKQEWVLNTRSGLQTVWKTYQSDSNSLVTIELDSLPLDSINILVEGEQNGRYMQSYEWKESNADTIQLHPLALVQGTLQGQKYPQAIAIAGTDYVAQVNPTTGEFSFPKIPAGQYNFVSVSAGTLHPVSSVQVNSNSQLNLELEVDATEVMIDDFNLFSNENLLAPFYDFGSWYIVKNSGVQVLFPEQNTDSAFIEPQTARTATEAFQGLSMHLQYYVESAGFYLITGVQVTELGGLNHLAKVSFWAKGNDDITVRLHGEEQQDNPKAASTVTLTPEWSYFEIPVGDFIIYDTLANDAVWDDVKQRMQWISFMAQGKNPDGVSTDFWLDNVKLSFIIP